MDLVRIEVLQSICNIFILAVPTTRRAIVIAVIVLFVGQFSGAFLFASYASSIFRDAGAIIHPDLCAVIVGILQFLGSYTTTVLIENQGRKVSRRYVNMMEENFSFSVVIVVPMCETKRKSTFIYFTVFSKALLIASSFGSAIFLFLMGAYSYYKYLGYDVSEFMWVPLVSLSGVIYVSSCGVRTVPYIVAAEILPQKV